MGAQLRADAVKQLAKDSDLVILLGTELAQTDHWDDDLPSQLTPNQIRVNLNSGSLLAGDKTQAINADVGSVVNQLMLHIDQAGKEKYQQALDRINKVKNALTNDLTQKEQRHMKVMEVVMPLLPENCTVVSDMTQLAYTSIDFIALEKPNSWFHPTGYGTLGYGLPAGMGVAIAKSDQPVLVMVGDAGLQYTMQEMTLAAELNLDIVVLLWNNDALSQIRDDMVGANIDPFAVTQTNPDFIKLSEACGWNAVTADSLDDLRDQLAVAFSSSTGPMLIKLNENELS